MVDVEKYIGSWLSLAAAEAHTKKERSPSGFAHTMDGYG